MENAPQHAHTDSARSMPVKALLGCTVALAFASIASAGTPFSAGVGDPARSFSKVDGRNFAIGGGGQPSGPQTPWEISGDGFLPVDGGSNLGPDGVVAESGSLSPVALPKIRDAAGSDQVGLSGVGPAQVNAVPSPGAVVLIGVAGGLSLMRRRARLG